MGKKGEYFLSWLFLTHISMDKHETNVIDSHGILMA